MYFLALLSMSILGTGNEKKICIYTYMYVYIDRQSRISAAYTRFLCPPVINLNISELAFELL